MTTEIANRIIEATNDKGEKVGVDITWPGSQKDKAWSTIQISGECEGCGNFIPKSVESEKIRHALENDPKRWKEFSFGNYLGICMRRVNRVEKSKVPARNTPLVVFPTYGRNNQRCQALLRSKPSY